MKNLTVGIFHDDTLGSDLGKIGTDTDIVMHNRKTDTTIFTFMQPKEGKLFPKAQIMSTIDAAIVSFSEITPETGETILMLDSLGIARGIILTGPATEMDKLSLMIKGTTLESFKVMERDALKIMEALEEMDPERDTTSPPIVEVDHSFSVKGVGEVVLGFVKKGTLKKHDKLQLMPLEKEIVVRSIQMHDKDFDEASAGSRVGLCIKGATSEDMGRGSILCPPDTCKKESKITLSFQKSKFYTEPMEEGVFHIAVGMQTTPVKASNITSDSITIESDKPLLHYPGNTFLLLNLNAKKLHLVGSGKA